METIRKTENNYTWYNPSDYIIIPPNGVYGNYKHSMIIVGGFILKRQANDHIERLEKYSSKIKNAFQCSFQPDQLYVETTERCNIKAIQFEDDRIRIEGSHCPKCI